MQPGHAPRTPPHKSRPPTPDKPGHAPRTTPHEGQLPTPDTLSRRMNVQAGASSSRDPRSWQGGQPQAGYDSGDEFGGQLIQLEDFRAGFPKPLPKKPVRMLPIATNPRLEVWTRCRDLTLLICRDEKLSFREIGVYMLQGARDETPRTTLQIVVDDNHQHDLWRTVLNLIFLMLQEEVATDLAALIACAKVPDPKFIFAVEYGHPLVQLWPNKLLHPVVKLLHNYRLDFGAVEVFHYGTRPETAVPTILITVEDEYADRRAWDMARKEITDLCHSEGCELPLVLKEGNCSFAKDQMLIPTGGVANKVYSKLIHMGSSIGIEKKGSGTVGGYLRLINRQTGGLISIAGLTNYHVIRPSAKDWPAVFDKGFTVWPPHKGSVQSPSQEDHRAEIDDLKKSIAYEQKRFNGKTFKMKIEIELSQDPVIQKCYDDAKANIQTYIDRLSFCERLDPIVNLDYGKVVASSGFRVSSQTRHALDWALIGVDHTRIGENKFPVSKHLSSFMSEERDRITHLSAGDLRSENEVFKIGRTTGLTCDKFHAIDPYVAITMPPNSENEAPPKRVSTECSFVVDYPTEDEFSVDGDSGAWVMGREGVLVGMIWGRGGTGSCYVTPIAEILRDIEATMGVNVALI